MNSKPLLAYSDPIEHAFFLTRHKRFLIQVEQNGSHFWIHTNNSGSMLSLLKKGRPVLMSRSDNPKRKYPHTLEAIKLDTGWCGVNTLSPNKILRSLFTQHLLPIAWMDAGIRMEVKARDSRFDALVTSKEGERFWLEAKNVSLVEEDVAYFPDARTERGNKHLNDLAAMVELGDRAACVFVVQRDDARCFAPADFIDPAYAESYHKAMERGVEMWAFVITVTEEGLFYKERLPLTQLK